MPPQTRYARSGDLHIAYQTLGDGPRDLVLVDQWFSNVDAAWEFPPLAKLMTRLASFPDLTPSERPDRSQGDRLDNPDIPLLLGLRAARHRRFGEGRHPHDVHAVRSAAGSRRVSD